MIREAKLSEFDAIWSIFQPIVSAGDTYTYPQDTDSAAALKLWLTDPQKTFVYEESGEILGTYYLKPNQLGRGNHVCNCGYMVANKGRGQGIATAMCLHSQDTALQLGYAAMQFNFVISTNTHAIQLWEKLGFEITGRLPKAFNHPTKGYVDALIMYKWLLKA